MVERTLRMGEVKGSIPFKSTNMASQKHTILHYLFTAFYVLIKSLIFSLGWIFIAAGGYFVYQTKKTPVDLILGLPLMLVGGGLAVSKLWSGFLAIFSPTYNRGVCRLCSKE